MNSKTAKLVNRFAAVRGMPKRYVKRIYSRTPKRLRFLYKEEMRSEVFEKVTAPKQMKLLGELAGQLKELRNAR